MLQTVHLFSVAMSIIATLLAARAYRSPESSPTVRRASASTMLISAAVVIGIAPQALLPDVEWLLTAGPVSSIVLSVITLFVLRRWRSAPQAS